MEYLTENLSWYFSKEANEDKAKVRMDGRYSSEELRRLADRLDAVNAFPSFPSIAISSQP